VAQSVDWILPAAANISIILVGRIAHHAFSSWLPKQANKKGWRPAAKGLGGRSCAPAQLVAHALTGPV
jgi:hypothetical protein